MICLECNSKDFKEEEKKYKFYKKEITQKCFICEKCKEEYMNNEQMENFLKKYKDIKNEEISKQD